MVVTELSKELIDAGSALVSHLDESGAPPGAAFWFYFSETGAWKLVLAEIGVKGVGPKEVYRRIQGTLASAGDTLASIALEDVALAKPDSPVVALLHIAIKTGPGVSGIRFKGNVINGTLVDDAYIYRMS
ncbi:MAG: hypothetical protein DRI65_18790 [Chloroflexota bacterium]|nr:MAG: hypothetical protein DRI65_18790 [Chloroflexota bacterium]